MRNAAQVIEQLHYGLITKREARATLRRIANQEKFNADYSDHIDSYKRHTTAARFAAASLRSI